VTGFGVQQSILSEDAMEFCRTHLQQYNWRSGVVLSPYEKILRYNMNVAHQKKTIPEYNTPKNITSQRHTSISTKALSSRPVVQQVLQAAQLDC
jgi:hypothetical protein